MPSRGIRDLREPGPAKPVCGLLYSDFSKAELAISMLEAILGPLDLTSFVFPFDVTDYYNQETGEDIKRLFVSFSRPVPQDSLADIKVRCRDVELEFAENGQRAVNIDPGMVTAERLVLATSKNFTHRIYIGRGVHADLSLIYQGKSFQPLPWTFADYRKQEVIEFWNVVRSLFMETRG
jgi:hypothetical protein